LEVVAQNFGCRSDSAPISYLRPFWCGQVR
jgi:hypothetical protein